jgi:putative phosphoribosyl transferase
MNTSFKQEIVIPAGKEKIVADLTIPGNATAIVVFARAGTDCRSNPRDRIVATHLQAVGFGTLLPDLLNEEEFLHSKEFDVDLLTARLLIVTKWLLHRDLFSHYRLGYFGVTTGAASALQAAACLKEAVGAVVCRGGKPDLAADVIPELQSPTLLIVGGQDRYVARLNREALAAFSCPGKIEIVQGATHLFRDDKITEVARLTEAWFNKYLQAAAVINHQKTTYDLQRQNSSRHRAGRET